MRSTRYTRAWPQRPGGPERVRLMSRRALALALLALLLSGCSIFLKDRGSTGPDGENPAGSADRPLAVNVVISQRLEETDSGVVAHQPYQHTFPVGQPAQPGFIVRLDGLKPGAHILKLRARVDAAPSDRLESEAKLFGLKPGQQPTEDQRRLFQVRKMLAEAWWTEATREFNVTGHPGFWAYHTFINDLVLLAWTEGEKEVEVWLDGKLVHKVWVRFLTTESLRKLQGGPAGQP